MFSSPQMGKKCLLWNSSPSGSTTNLLWTMEGENDIMCVKWISKNQITLGFRNGVIKIWEINSSLTKASCTATFPVDDPTVSISLKQISKINFKKNFIHLFDKEFFRGSAVE